LAAGIRWEARWTIVAPLLCQSPPPWFLTLPCGRVELGTDGWIQISKTQFSPGAPDGTSCHLHFGAHVFSSGFLGHFIEHKLGLNRQRFCSCAQLASSSEPCESVQTTTPALGALTVYALGKTFFADDAGRPFRSLSALRRRRQKRKEQGGGKKLEKMTRCTEASIVGNPSVMDVALNACCFILTGVSLGNCMDGNLTLKLNGGKSPHIGTPYF